jgi:hypothetical protein
MPPHLRAGPGRRRRGGAAAGRKRHRHRRRWRDGMVRVYPLFQRAAEGIEPRRNKGRTGHWAHSCEYRACLEYCEWTSQIPGTGSGALPQRVSYTEQAALACDTDNLKTALAAVDCEGRSCLYRRVISSIGTAMGTIGPRKNSRWRWPNVLHRRNTRRSWMPASSAVFLGRVQTAVSEPERLGCNCPRVGRCSLARVGADAGGCRRGLTPACEPALPPRTAATISV